jgi:4a-hydroxytetrahydrobiopterin dehydratase
MPKLAANEIEWGSAWGWHRRSSYGRVEDDLTGSGDSVRGWHRLKGLLFISMTLADQEVEERLAGGEWRREGTAIVREWTFADFAQAIAFVNRVAEAAEAANHHPDIAVHGWNKVRLELSTHSQGGLTEADFGMAARIDSLA